MVRIVVDSACDLTKEKADALNLDFMPLKTIFGEEEFLDGITLSHEDFFKKLEECDDLPTTSQVSPYDFETKFEEIRKAGDTAVVITISSLLSGTFQSATIAASEYEDIVFPVDSKTLCLAEQNLVLYAVELRDKGLSAKEIAAELDRVKDRSKLFALFDTIEYVSRGGRVSKAIAIAGNLLSIKPIISTDKGEVIIPGKARGMKKGFSLLKDTVNGCRGVDFSMPACLGYSGLSDDILQKFIGENPEFLDGKLGTLPISTVGSTVGTHAGPGAICIAFFEVE